MPEGIRKSIITTCRSADQRGTDGGLCLVAVDCKAETANPKRRWLDGN
jgi:hypothetical protein